MLAESQFCGDLRQGIAAYQRGALPGQGTLIRERIGLVEHACDRTIEDRITQKLEPFIVMRSGAAMRERDRAKLGLREHVAERPLHPRRHVHHCRLRYHSIFTVVSKLTVSETLPM